MKRLLVLPVLLLTLLVGNPALSADFQKGSDAYNKKDYATALREWAPLAEQGNAIAQTNLGRMYLFGEGVPQDFANAVKWYTLAAEQGEEVSQYNLGVMYASGMGVPQDNVYAHMWMQIAEASGQKKAALFKWSLAKDMTPADISAAQKLARECVRKKYKGC